MDNKKENIKLICLIVICIVFIGIIVMVLSSGGDEINKNVSVLEGSNELPAVTEAATEGSTEIIADLPVEMNEELNTNLAELNNKLKAYYEEHISDGSVISSFGLLTFADSGIQAEPKDILGKEPAENVKDAYILLVRPADFEVAANSSELDIDLNDDELRAFTAVCVEGGYLISSADSSGGIISYDDFKALLKRYISEHGNTVYAPDRESATYKKIVEAAEKVCASQGEVDFKYVGYDDKYAVAVCNFLERPTEFKELLLMKSGGVWSVKHRELNEKDNVVQFVNQKYPDFNLGLLPYYDLKAVKESGDITSDFGYYDEIVGLDIGVSANDLPAKYCLYAEGFVYYEFGNGAKVVGRVEAKGEKKNLTFRGVADQNEAIAWMQQFSDKPPVYIIKFS